MTRNIFLFIYDKILHLIELLILHVFNLTVFSTSEQHVFIVVFVCLFVYSIMFLKNKPS